MADIAAGVKFNVLGPTDSIEESRLAEFYSYPADLHRCWVRGNMIASLDGGATSDGKSGGLAGAGDRSLHQAVARA